jgi:methyltransferase (TIGR00027 family)
MEEGRPSFTALTAAMQRAVHLHLDAPPKIMEDTLALPLCGFENADALRKHYEALVADVARKTSLEFARTALAYARAFTVMRTRYVEDQLDEAIRRSVSQYVILGAGLDSYAYRRRDLVDVIHVFEVDHPASQTWKRTRLNDLHIELPCNLTFVPLDFEKQTLAEGLRSSGYRSDVPALFSWLGVTYYLTVDAIFSTLRTVASMAPGTEIIFEYALPLSLLDEAARQGVSAIMKQAAARGEPLISFYDPQSLATQVRELGFAEVWDFGNREAAVRYFAGRSDDFRLPLDGGTHLMGARVEPRG